MKNNMIKISKDFIKNVLKKDLRFKKIIENNAYDLILLGGSVLSQLKDGLSDTDIFVVCTKKNQKKYSLTPVNTYKYKNQNFEVSMISTEKLLNDQVNKKNLFWWHKTIILKNRDRKIIKVFKKASSISKQELLDRLWTNFVLFEINYFNLEKQLKRKEKMSARILFNENIRLVVDSLLIDKKEFPNLKWMGTSLRVLDKINYKKILQIQDNVDNNEKKASQKLRKIIVQTLKTNGFSDKEILNWEKCNLEKLIFQYK